MIVVLQLIRKSMYRVVVLLLIATIVMATSCDFGKNIFPTITNDEAEEMKNICNNIKFPPSFVKIKEIDTIKSNLASRSLQFNSTDSTEDVENYFIKQLSDLGWKYEKGRIGDSISLRFKKGKYTISMEIESSELFNRENKLHSISCSIGVF